MLYDDWTVNCYDHHLQLLWSQVLLDVNFPRQRYEVRTAGVLITPHTLASEDNGTVVVAASFVHADHNIRFVNCDRSLSRVVPDLRFPNPARAGFCRILMANSAGAGFFIIATT